MSLTRFDKYFGGERGAAERAFEAMKRTYGRKDGENVFYGTIAKRKRSARVPPGVRRRK